MAVRLKDIAADVGVSTITVSKVLRNKPDVGAETRKRVLQRIKELNYRPNMLARGLASGRSNTVGLIVPDLVHTFFAEFAKGLKAGLRKRGYQLVLASAEEDPEMESEEIENLLARGVDALLVASCQTNAEGLKSLLRNQFPYVLIDRVLPDVLTHFVGTDDFAAGSMATEHLLSLGRRRIAHIGNPEVSTGADRYRGYKEALQLVGIPLNQSLVVQSARLEEAGDKAGYDNAFEVEEPPGRRLLLQRPVRRRRDQGHPRRRASCPARHRGDWLRQPEARHLPGGAPQFDRSGHSAAGRTSSQIDSVVAVGSEQPRISGDSRRTQGDREGFYGGTGLSLHWL